LGEVEGPSVVFRAVIAFLLPLVVFIASLIVFERILGGAIGNKGVQTAVSFISALLVTFVLILIIRVINKQRCKSR